MLFQCLHKEYLCYPVTRRQDLHSQRMCNVTKSIWVWFVISILSIVRLLFLPKIRYDLFVSTFFHSMLCPLNVMHGLTHISDGTVFVLETRPRFVCVFSEY